jgi:hypothetical protein
VVRFLSAATFLCTKLSLPGEWYRHVTADSIEAVRFGSRNFLGGKAGPFAKLLVLRYVFFSLSLSLYIGLGANLLRGICSEANRGLHGTVASSACALWTALSWYILYNKSSWAGKGERLKPGVHQKLERHKEVKG